MASTHARTYTYTHTHTHLLWLSVEEEIRHDIPGEVSADGAPEPKDFTTQQPPHQAQRVLALQARQFITHDLREGTLERTTKILTTLLQGIATSTYFSGELVLQKAITGMFT